ncbi:hypothetical protein ACS0TY_009332 [Phlomoides rotata]
MQAILPSVVNISLNFCLKIKNPKQRPFSSPSKNTPYEIPHSALCSSPPPILGVCRSSQVGELFPTTSDEVVVREARIEEFWEVAETHCSSFFPAYSFPLDFALRLNRLLSMLFAVSLPKGCKRTCLVAVGGFEGRFGNVAGILTVDTLANFLPRKGPLRLRRTGIAYISNVAVREKFRRKGIAKRLIAKAEATAKSWGCLAIALHCDLRDRAVVELYTSQGFKSIKVPDGANWPRPRASVDVQFNFMMKLLNSPTSSVST